MDDTSCGCSAHNGFLTAKGLEEAALRIAMSREAREMGLTDNEKSVILDYYRSVSALTEAEAADRFYGVQQDMFDWKEIHNGS